MTIRKRLTADEANFLELTVKENEPGRNTARYTISDADFDRVLNRRNNNNFITVGRTVVKGNVTSERQKRKPAHVDVPDNFDIVKMSVNPTSGQQWVTAVKNEDKITTQAIKDVIASLGIQPLRKPDKDNTCPHNNPNDGFDRLIITDVHIGMGSDNKDAQWKEGDINERFDDVIRFVRRHQSHSFIVVDDLGDFLDNYDGFTTRHKHKIPQSMSSAEAFKVGLNAKISLVDNLLENYDMVSFHNVCNDNHGGTFGEVLNVAFAEMADARYGGRVTVNNFTGFMEHYTMGNHAFILSHGKDKEYALTPFPTKVNARVNEIISGYITKNKLYDMFVEFSKGDSHQMLFDTGVSARYDYCNYPKLSPSSDWSTTNFGGGRSGVVMQNIVYDRNEKEINYMFF